MEIPLKSIAKVSTIDLLENSDTLIPNISEKTVKNKVNNDANYKKEVLVKEVDKSQHLEKFLEQRNKQVKSKGLKTLIKNNQRFEKDGCLNRFFVKKDEEEDSDKNDNECFKGIFKSFSFNGNNSNVDKGVFSAFSRINGDGNKLNNSHNFLGLLYDNDKKNTRHKTKYQDEIKKLEIFVNTVNSDDSSFIELYLLNSQDSFNSDVRPKESFRGSRGDVMEDLTNTLFHAKKGSKDNLSCKKHLNDINTTKLKHNKKSNLQNGGVYVFNDLDTQNKHKSKCLSENFECIINSLPKNFKNLPYSQRKKLVNSFSDKINYSEFSLFAKNYFNDKAVNEDLPSKRTFYSLDFTKNHSIGRSRTCGVNTIANRLLALSSSAELKKNHIKPKENVNEKGSFVLGYELGKVIGSGTWGVVRECVNKIGVVKSIKIVNLNLDNSNKSQHNHVVSESEVTKMREVFRNEILIWKSLKHEGIVTLYDHLETNDYIFFVMDRIYGGTLFDLVSSWGLYSKDLPNISSSLEFLIEGQIQRIKLVINFVLQIASALRYLHDEKNIVHGDLKLENVLVEKNHNGFKLLLCDFGMSRSFTHDAKSSKKLFSLSNDKIKPKSILDRLKKNVKNSPFNLMKNSNDNFLANKNSFNDFEEVSNKPCDFSIALLSFKPNHSSQKNKSIQKINYCNEVNIGSLPYAAPEILSSYSCILKPSTDIWAMGIMMYTMTVGKLPFYHQHELKLIALITSGKYNKDYLAKACLLEWFFKDTSDDVKLNSDLLKSLTFFNINRNEEIIKLHNLWINYKKKHCFKWFFEIITQSIQLNSENRYSLSKIILLLGINSN